MYIKSCLVCENDTLVPYLDLGMQPLANSYRKATSEHLIKYPLQLQVCPKCWHSQLTYQVNPDEMFKNYLYVSDTSKTLTDYFNSLCNKIVQEKTYQQVLEIACNTGLFLEMFQNKGIKCYGVDPAENLREVSKSRNLNVYVDYWGESFASKFKSKNGQVDLILAMHVLPHVKDPNEFLRACKSVLSDNGRIYIQTSQCDMFINNEFDVVYHEHASYFTANSIKTLAHKNGFKVASIEKMDIHGKSYLFSLAHEESYTDAEYQLIELIEVEDALGLYSVEKYKSFASLASKIKQQVFFELNYYRQRGYTIVGYGAAAKGNTLLNYIHFAPDIVIDDNPLKHDYLLPGVDTKIVGIEWLEQASKHPKICFLPLAWNFYREIKEKIVTVRKNNLPAGTVEASIPDVFIKYFPYVSIESFDF